MSMTADKIIPRNFSHDCIVGMLLTPGVVNSCCLISPRRHEFLLRWR